VPLKTQAGAVIFVEAVPEIATSAYGHGEIASGSAEAALTRLADVGEQIGEVCNEVCEHATASLAGARPAELVLEFGLKLGGEAGLPFVAKGSAEATFTIRATWTQDRD
jgi:hypothetical protein